MSRHTLLLLTASLVLMGSNLSSAQSFTPQGFKFIGAPDYSDAELLATANLKPGVEIKTEDMPDHTRPLLESGIVDTLSYEFDGTNLIVHMKMVTNLYPLKFINVPIPPSPELDNEIHNIVPLYHGKLPADGTLIANVRAALQTILNKRGMKVLVAASPYVDPHTQQVTHIDFSITAPVILVGDIVASGPQPELRKNVLAIAQRYINTPYDQDTSVVALRQDIENYYTDRGFVAVKVDVDASATPVVMKDSILVPMSLQIEEGHFFKLGAIHIDPGIPIPKEDIYKTLNMNAGDRIKGANLRAVWDLISTRCKARGYLTCVVNPKLQLDEANDTASYNVSVIPGPIYRFTKVTFDGFTKAQSDTLMLDWKLKPGDPIDETFMSSFFNKMANKYPPLGEMLKNKKINYVMNPDPDAFHLKVLYTFTD